MWTLFPLYVMAIASITPELDISTQGFHLLPAGFTGVNFRYVFQLYSQSELTGAFGVYESSNLPYIPTSFLNSFILSIATSVVAIAIASLGGYAFGRLRFRF